MISRVRWTIRVRRNDPKKQVFISNVSLIDYLMHIALVRLSQVDKAHICRVLLVNSLSGVRDVLRDIDVHEAESGAISKQSSVHHYTTDPKATNVWHFEVNLSDCVIAVVGDVVRISDAQQG